MKKIFVSQITEHLSQELVEEFYLKDIYLDFTKDNRIPYYKLKLQDKSGSIVGRIWDNNMEDDYLKLKGKVVMIYGEAILFSNHTEIICWKMEAVTEYYSTDFIQGITEAEKEEYINSLFKQKRLVKTKNLSQLLDIVFEKHLPKLSEVPASLNSSGNYNGGLLVQTVSVTSMALQIMRSQKLYAYHPNLKLPFQEDILVAGALLSGLGTINLYSPFPEAYKISEYTLLSKSALSIQIIEECTSKMTDFLSVEEKNLLYHIIQTAPLNESIKPMTREALIVHMAYSTYVRLASHEFYLSKNQDMYGAVYVPDMNNYIYLTKNQKNGGTSHEPIEFYKPRYSS